MKNKIYTFGAIASSLIATGNHSAIADNENSKPNIVVIFADDLGYGDLTCYNPESKAPTPHLDKLATDGVRFTDGHSNAAVSTPSRYGLLTGRYTWRTRLKAGVLMGYSPALISSERATLATLTKAAGYNTACVGKWHLGMNWPKKAADKSSSKKKQGAIDYTADITGGPNDVGFDYYYGISASLDMPPYTWIENRRVKTAPSDSIKGNRGPLDYWRGGSKAPDFKMEEGLDRISQKAAEYIRSQNSEKPFFLYVPLPSPHKPVLPSPRFKGKSQAGDYGDYVVQTDWATGNILNALKAKGFYKNTLVIFTSDNGSFANMEKYGVTKLGHSPNKHLRGGKTDIWEGGHRVPFIASWPAKIKGNQTYDGTVSTTDLYATIAETIGAKPGVSEGVDSWSFMPAMQGKQKGNKPGQSWIFHSASGKFAIRNGKWKFIATKGSGGRGGRGAKNDPAGQLYDMENDVEEKNNLFLKEPEVVADMLKKLKAIVENGRATPGSKQQNTGKTNYLSKEMKKYLVPAE